MYQQIMILQPAVDADGKFPVRVLKKAVAGNDPDPVQEGVLMINPWLFGRESRSMSYNGYQ
jgi:hypothetical protein